MVKVLVPVANGTEEMEAVIVIDMLRRAGINVTVASSENIVTCSKGTRIIPDCKLDSLLENEEFDAVVLPGGIPGTDNLSANEELIQIIERLKQGNKLICAVCAAPTILTNNKILDKETILTSHPSVKSMLKDYNYSESDVVVYNNIITSRGAGTTFDFALEIITQLISKEKADEVKKSIVYN